MATRTPTSWHPRRAAAAWSRPGTGSRRCARPSCPSPHSPAMPRTMVSWPSVGLSQCVSQCVCQYVSRCVCQCVSVCVSMYLNVCVSVCFSVCVSVFVSVCVWTSKLMHAHVGGRSGGGGGGYLFYYFEKGKWGLVIKSNIVGVAFVAGSDADQCSSSSPQVIVS